MPDDGRRYELIDGMLIVSPVPAMPHQRVGFFLGILLEEACPDDLVVFGTPVNVRFSLRTALEPDVVVARVEDSRGVRLEQTALLVAEVLSPDSVLRDLNLKKAAYERFGIPSYWVVDPDFGQACAHTSSTAGLMPKSRTSPGPTRSAPASRSALRSFRTGWSPSSAAADYQRPGRESATQARAAIGQVIGRALAGRRCSPRSSPRGIRRARRATSAPPSAPAGRVPRSAPCRARRSRRSRRCGPPPPR